MHNMVPDSSSVSSDHNDSFGDLTKELMSKHQHDDDETLTPERLLRMAPEILQQVDEAEILLQAKRKQFPTFDRNEIIFGEVLGTGSFGIVREVVAFNLKKKKTTESSQARPTGSLMMQQHARRCSSTNTATSSDSSSDEENSGRQGGEGRTIATTTTKNKNLSTSLAASVLTNTTTTTNSEHTSRTTPLFYSSETFREDSHYDVETARKTMKKRCMRDGEARYAVKCLNVDDLDDDFKLVRGRIDVAIEIKYLQALDHPNIVRMRGLHNYQSKNDNDNHLHPCSFFLMDRLYGTLADKFKEWRKDKKRGKGNIFLGKRRDQDYLNDLWVERLVVAYDIRSALDYMHSHKMIYRDIKPENIGFDIRGDVKLFDFGLAKSLHKDSVTDHDPSLYHLSAPTGSFPYMAPEVVHIEPYNEKCDVFSFGILLYEILSLHLIKTQRRPRDIWHKISVQGEMPRKHRHSSTCFWSPRLKQLVKVCWSPNPKWRPSMNDIGNKLGDELQAIQEENFMRDRSDQLDEKSVMSIKRSLSMRSVKSAEMEGRR